jgi:hypothetical protein
VCATLTESKSDDNASEQESHKRRMINKAPPEASQKLLTKGMSLSSREELPAVKTLVLFSSWPLKELLPQKVKIIF